MHGAELVGTGGACAVVDELLGELSPVALGLVRADAVDAELVVAVVDDALFFGAAQDFDDVADAEALAG